MNQFSCAIKCKQCRCVLESPVFLPCSHSVCKKHEQERNSIVCIECDTEFEVPKGGFFPNKDLALVIASNIFDKINEKDLGPEHKRAVESCNEVKTMIEQIEILLKDPMGFVKEEIVELKLRIDLAREELKLRIDQEAETILEQLKKYESECEKNVKSNDVLSKVNEIENKLNANKLDVDKWMIDLDTFKVDIDEWEKIEKACDGSFDELQDELESFKERLLMSSFNEIQETVEGFEKIEISFDYRSPIESECYKKHELAGSAFYFIVLQDGKSLACADVGGLISIWDAETLAIKMKLTGHTRYINCFKKMYDGSLASGSGDNTIKIWNTQSGQLLRSLESHTDKVRALEQLSDGFLASSALDKTIKIWNPNTGELLKTIDIGEGIYSICLLRDGNLACTSETKLSILNPQTNQIVKTIENNSFYKHCLLSDGNLAIGHEDSNITIWDASRWELLRTLKGHSDSITELKLLSDGSLASVCKGGEMRIWNPINGNLLKAIKNKNDGRIYTIDQLSDDSLVILSNDFKFLR